MDPSKEKDQKQTVPSKRKPNIIPIILLVLLIAASCGAAFYYYTSAHKAKRNTAEIDSPVTRAQIIEDPLINRGDKTTSVLDDGIETTDLVTDPPAITHADKPSGLLPSELPETPTDIKQSPNLDKEEPVKISICSEPAKQLDTFYQSLDKEAYMSAYKIDGSSKNHFSKLIQKLLANPPQVTRESDDLYTILRNTAHFFRISGKDNILMMKGILDNEKNKLEQILSDYYLLVSNAECSTSGYGNVDKDALYEYACFFLNTMGGRLYLFRRDSLSRMVVTYYAVLLVDEANIQNNNRHGIALRPVVDMLINEMEMGGSSLKKSDIYLNKLYDLKEKYQ